MSVLTSSNTTRRLRLGPWFRNFIQPAEKNSNPFVAAEVPLTLRQALLAAQQLKLGQKRAALIEQARRGVRGST